MKPLSRRLVIIITRLPSAMASTSPRKWCGDWRICTGDNNNQSPRERCSRVGAGVGLAQGFEVGFDGIRKGFEVVAAFESRDESALANAVREVP